MFHFIGIKGSGMASLAHIVLDLGYEVSGSDVDFYIFTQSALENRNVKIYSFSKNNIQDNMTVIIGNSFNEQHEEVQAALNNPTVKTFTYQSFLAKLLNDYQSISVVGTHGKTTTTGMLTHILEPLKRGFLIGDGTGGIIKDASYFVAECCEFEDRFLAYTPDYAVILNIELDHVDYFKTLERYCQSFQKFANQVKKVVALNGDDQNIRNLNIENKKIYFGLHEDNDVLAKNIVENETTTQFDVYYKNEYYDTYIIPLVGRHMLYDALGCITILIAMQIDKNLIRERIATFKGTKRRFSVEKYKEYVYIDDYAHHPTAITATIDAIRRSYPNKKVVAVYKPDRPTRVTHFLQAFKNALDLADYAVVTAYPKAVTFAENEIDGKQLAQYCNAFYAENEDEADGKIVAEYGEAVYVFMSTKDVYKFKDVIKKIHMEQ